MPGTYDLGPYYRTSRRAMEGQRRALGYAPMSPEQIAGERYGEVGAYLTDEEQRRQYEQNLALNRERLNQNMYFGTEQLRNQNDLIKANERGQTVSGIATGFNILDKLGAFGKTGLLNRAYTGLSNWMSPKETVNVQPGGWNDLTSPINYDFFPRTTGWSGNQDWSFDMPRYSFNFNEAW